MRNTDVFHEPTRVSLHQRTSIPHTSHLQPTMIPLRRAEIPGRGCGSSTDPEVKASSGRLVATCRLLKSRSVFLAVYVDIGHGINLRSALFNLLNISCILSIIRSVILSPLLPPVIMNIPRAREILAPDSFPSASRHMNIQQEAREVRDRGHSHHP